MVETDGTVLVTGASGFVGRNLVAALAATGRPFRALGRDKPKADASTDWSAALTGVSAVVHLAGRHQGDDAAFEADIGMTLNLAREAERCGVGRLVYLSSIKVNGEKTAPGAAFSERDAPDPQDSYGRAKLRMEQGLAALQLPVTIIRPPLVYGPGVRANFRRLMQGVERGVPLPLGAVDNRRSLLAMGNLCDFILTSLDRPEAAGETYVLADGEDVSTTDLLRRLARALDRPSRLVPVPRGLLENALRLAGFGSVGERLLGNLCVDASKAMNQLGWRPPLSVDQGLAALASQ